MHCLGAVVGGNVSPNGVGSCGGVVSVVRALGVLVSEGRIQTLPRGYKEGPHCAAPLQATSTGHECEKDNYLCDRYLILIREITDRIAIGTFLCVEVLLCTDCPCGLAKATSKDPIFPIPSISISPWQHTTEMLLEYWCIGVVSSKGPEMMNSQGLYQAVRSRLHFSQVAAWWSRSKGSKPSYVATRVVPYNEDNLRKFRESPSEHTFPLAGSGDGNSIKVTVWALPRMEDVPILTCPIHPIADKDAEGAARALTPTKNIPVSTVSQKPETLVLPALVDDRLQTPCNEPGKHHCRCEEEDTGCPPSPSVKSNGERKRRRSLPCGPADVDSCPLYHPIVLSSVQELAGKESNDHDAKACDSVNFNQSFGYSRYPERTNYHGRAFGVEQDQEVQQVESETNFNSLERCFMRQLSIEEQEGNVEKRYKRTIESTGGDMDNSFCRRREKSPKFGKKRNNNSNGWERTYDDGILNVSSINGESVDAFGPFDVSMLLSSSGNTSWKDDTDVVEDFHDRKKQFVNDTLRNAIPPVPRETNLVINPFRERSPFHEANSGPSTYSLGSESKSHLVLPACSVHQSCRTLPSSESAVVDRLTSGKDALSERSEMHVDAKRRESSNKDLSRLMSKLTFPEEKDEIKEEGGILDWISKVPGRVLSVATNNGLIESKPKTNDLKSRSAHVSEVKFKNCNLELSQREFDEVLAVLRTRTPSGRRRTAALRTMKKRDRSEKLTDEVVTDTNTLRSPSVNLEDCRYQPRHEEDRTVSSGEECDCKFCKKMNDRVSGKSALTNSGGCNESVRNRLKPTLRGPGKLANSRSMKDEECMEAEKLSEFEKRTRKSADCFYNVSNKADLLLGAILRTSRDRKGLSDISNGTRPRTALPFEKSEHISNIRDNSTEIEQTNQDPKIVPLEDGRSLPSALNKRFNRFRQFFQREQDTKEVLTSNERFSRGSQRQPSVSELSHSSSDVRQRVQSQKIPKAGRVRRKIDFSNLPEKFMRAGEHRESLSESSSTSGAHQNSMFHSTNYEEYDDSANHGKACPRDSLTYRMCQNRRDRHLSTNANGTNSFAVRCEDRKNAYYAHHDGQNNVSSLSPQNVFFDRILSQDNGCSSSRLRSNNNNNNNNKWLTYNTIMVIINQKLISFCFLHMTAASMP